MRSRLALLLALVLVVGAVGAVLVWRRTSRPDLARAVALAPAGTERLSWTDWAAVRREVGADLGASPTPAELDAFLDEAFEQDLSGTSALVASSPTLQEQYGFSPASLSWELFAQGSDGAVDILGFPDGADLDELGDTLERLGYRRPDEEDGVWRGGADVVASIGPALTPELQFFAILDDGVVLTSDRANYLERAVAVAQGDDDAVEGLDDVVGASGDPVAASVFSGAYACEKLAMAQADPTDQEQADALVEDAGGVHPMTAFAMSTQLDGGVRVAMAFEGEDQAREDADSRSVLAAGPAPGQGGDFGDRFTVESATAEGSTVVLDLDPVSGQYVLSDLTSGPVLFATC